MRRLLINSRIHEPHHPHHPTIYVRGFAATQSEIEETVADPYMGFNLGSTKARQVWTGELKKFFFELPMVRLQVDYDPQSNLPSQHRHEDEYPASD